MEPKKFIFDTKVIHIKADSKAVFGIDPPSDVPDIPVTACGIVMPTELWSFVDTDEGYEKCELCFPKAKEKKASFKAKKVEIVQEPVPARGVII